MKEKQQYCHIHLKIFLKMTMIIIKTNKIKIWNHKQKFQKLF